MHSLPAQLLCVKNLLLRFTQAIYLSIHPSVSMLKTGSLLSLFSPLSLFPFCLFLLSQSPLPFFLPRPRPHARHGRPQCSSQSPGRRLATVPLSLVVMSCCYCRRHETVFILHRRVKRVRFHSSLLSLWTPPDWSGNIRQPVRRPTVKLPQLLTGRKFVRRTYFGHFDQL